MKKIKLLIALFVVAFSMNSCNDVLDINTNPLVASSADPNVLLPYIFVQYSNRHTTELGTRTMDVPQHFTACFNSPRRGSTSVFLTGNTWRMYYTQVLGNAQLVENDAIAAGVSSNNINAISKVIRAKGMFELSAIWGDVPFTEALNGTDFPSPNFDSQEFVFNGCVDILDEAISLIDGMTEDGNFDVSVGDLIYGGNMDNWRRYANSLKLRILMLIRNKDTSVDAQITATLSEPLIEDNSQAAMLRYFDAPGNSNGFNSLIEAFFGVGNEANGVYAPGPDLYNLLFDSGDPRFDLLISDPDTVKSPGMGVFSNGGPGTCNITDNVIRNDLPHIMLLPAEISFYKAELALLGVGGLDATTEYKTGVTQILEFWGGDIPGAQITLSGDVISTFVDGLAAPSLQDVHEQLFLESFMRPIVAWNTVRRTKVPALQEVPGTSISTILKRFNYPPNEVSSNPNTPANVDTDVPQWFEN